VNEGGVIVGRVDRARIIGSIEERLLLHLVAHETIQRLERLHPELNLDIEALNHIRLGFLREPCHRLMGYCSYADNRSGRPRTEFSERHGTHRILLARKLLHENLKEAVITIHHELLHAILGSSEGHGPNFVRHEERMNDIAQQIAENTRRTTFSNN
jgi:hypothetical protein